MKVTFEGKTLGDVLEQIQGFIHRLYPDAPATQMPSGFPQGPGPEEVSLAGMAKSDTAAENISSADTADENIFDEPKPEPAPKKTRAKKAAAPEPEPEPEPKKPEAKKAPPKKVTEIKPEEVVAIRTKTIAELQSAYANGKHAEVLELLSRFGNGAKSFRELPPEAFVPIREAIDTGALT